VIGSKRRRLLGTSAMLAILVASPASAHPPASAAQQLAASYSPVLMLEPQPTPCGRGEACRPTSVDIVLGRRDVMLRDPHGRLVKRAPTGKDLWALADGYYLDFPGDPLTPGYYFDLEARGVAREPALGRHRRGRATRPVDELPPQIAAD
jgi:hypothetical protein